MKNVLITDSKGVIHSVPDTKRRVSKATSKNYYIVEIKYPESDWEIHFGSYNREDCVDEKQDLLDHNEYKEKGDRIKARIAIKVVPYAQYLLETE